MNSEGAPNFTSAERGARSAMLVRFHFFAVASVTVTVSLSLAGDGVSIARSPGSARYNSRSTFSGAVTVLSGSKYCSSVPVYSGIRSMEWSRSAGM